MSRLLRGGKGKDSAATEWYLIRGEREERIVFNAKISSLERVFEQKKIGRQLDSLESIVILPKGEKEQT